MKAFVAFTTAALLASAAAPVDAARIRYRYDGVVTSVPENQNNVVAVTPGSTFTGSLWLENTTPGEHTWWVVPAFHHRAYIDVDLGGTLHRCLSGHMWVWCGTVGSEEYFEFGVDSPHEAIETPGFEHHDFTVDLRGALGMLSSTLSLPNNIHFDLATQCDFDIAGERINGDRFRVNGTITSLRRIATLADMEFDGYSDIILSRGQHSFVWSMRGARRDGERLLTSQHTRFQVRGVGDVDGDGDSDIVWYDKQTCTARFGLLDDAVLVSKRFVGPAMGGNWELVAVGDFVGDDLAELVWRNRVTGQNRVCRPTGCR